MDNGRMKLFSVLPTLLFASICCAQIEPTTGLKSLDFMLGDWEGIVKITMPGSSDAVDVPTTVTVKPYGPFQETVYTMDMPGMGPFTSHMFLSYDEDSKRFQSWTFDNNANVPRLEKGSFDGKKLVMTSEPHGGMVTRITFEKKAATEIGFLLEMKNGDAFLKMGEGVYKKK